MCIVTSSCLALGPSVNSHFARFHEILLGSANTLKHSARLFLQVIDGSNRMSSLFSCARLFQCFLAGVSERFLCMSLYVRGFSLGKVFCILVSASCAQSWEVQHCLS